MFLIPNKGTALNTLQSRLFSQYLDVLVAGTTRTNFVVSGCDVVAQGVPNMTAAVGAGTIITNGVAHVIAGGNATIPTAHSSLPRLDLVVITSGGAIAVRQGTASAAPTPPDRVANDTVLAVVYVPAAVTAITNGHIVDLRIVNASITKNDVGLENVLNLDTSNPANIAQSASYRFVTDSEKSTWNGKQAALISGTNIKTINGESVLGAGNIVISGGGGVSLGETDTTAYRGDRGKIAYDHSQLTHDKAFVGLGNVPNVDATNPANTVQTASYRFVTDTEKATWNAKQDALVSATNIKTINGSSVLGAGNLAVGNALTTNDLSQFAATTSAQLRGVISDESGTGALLFGTSPTIATPIINVGSDATGDIYYRSAGGAFTRLGVTTNGYVLTLVAGLPAWAAAAGGGGASYDESNPIVDSSSNELLKFVKAATAVNEWTIANAASGSNPVFSLTGGDTNISGTVAPKGTGHLNLLTSNGSAGLVFDSVNYGSAYRTSMYSNVGDFHISQAGGQAIRFIGPAYYDLTSNLYCRWTINSAFKLMPNTPAEITANQNNYLSGIALTQEATPVYRLSSNASRNVTGLHHGGTGWNGQMVWLVNVGANDIVLKHQDAASTASNRFANTTGADITLGSDKIAIAWYDFTTSRWRVMPQF